MRLLRVIPLLLITASAFSRDKTPYQTTKLLELQASGTGFCFVVQLDDLAYIATATDPPASNLIVGDPVQVKVKGDNIQIMTDKKWPAVAPDGSIKAKVVGRKRMTADTKLPSCALAVTVH